MVTGSWDQTVKLWDPRTPCNAGTFSQPEKVCAAFQVLNNASWDWHITQDTDGAEFVKQWAEFVKLWAEFVKLYLMFFFKLGENVAF